MAELEDAAGILGGAPGSGLHPFLLHHVLDHRDSNALSQRDGVGPAGVPADEGPEGGGFAREDLFHQSGVGAMEMQHGSDSRNWGLSGLSLVLLKGWDAGDVKA